MFPDILFEISKNVIIGENPSPGIAIMVSVNKIFKYYLKVLVNFQNINVRVVTTVK